MGREHHTYSSTTLCQGANFVYITQRAWGARGSVYRYPALYLGFFSCLAPKCGYGLEKGGEKKTCDMILVSKLGIYDTVLY